jgi:hypothetical protein
MRAGPLSSRTVIDLLNSAFVPVFAVNEDYRDAGPAPDEEKAEYRRIYRQALDAKLSAGTVHAYVIDTRGHPTHSLHVADASQPDRLAALLERIIRERKLTSGPTLVAPRTLSAPPPAQKHSLVLHLTARGHGSSWDGFPSEDWIVLDPEKCAGLLPARVPEAGLAWSVRQDVATEILTHFYPQTENNDVGTHRFERRKLQGRIEVVTDGVAHAVFDGEVRMTHPFYPGRPDGNTVDASVIGYADFDAATRRIRRLRLVTDRATYGTGTLDVAVRSIERAWP